MKCREVQAMISNTMFHDLKLIFDYEEKSAVGYSNCCAFVKFK